MLKHLLILVVMVMSIPLQVSGEECPSPEGKTKEQIFQEIQEFKLKYLAQEIDLKEDQRQQFFDLYNEMTKKRFAAVKEARRLEKEIKKNKNASEEDYKTVTNALNKARSDEAAIEKEYDSKFSKFMTQKQIFKLKSAEESFRKKMEEMRHKHHGKRKDKKN